MPEDFTKISTLIDLLSCRSLQESKNKGYIFLNNGEVESASLTYQELEQQAKKIAALLQGMLDPGERALLLYPQGLDFISAFFGCLYAGVIAVPLYPPRRNQNLSRVQAVAEDAQAKVALTTQSIIKNFQTQLTQTSALGSLQWLTTDHLPDHSPEAQTWQNPNLDQNALAFIQYTSGSTGTPKGVMVTHGNLLHNSSLIYDYFHHSPESQGVSWLPFYHDMGLIGGIIQPLYGNFPIILMSPVDFLQKPYRWLQAVTRYRATTTGGPNFAYNLCLNKITSEQITTLDLSSLKVACSGAEPIQAETLKQFADKFAPCGFSPEAFLPCYGLAEATLFVSGKLKSQESTLLSVDEQALRENQVIVTPETSIKTLVGCGQASSDQKIVIVDVETRCQCPPEKIGEIWVWGPSIAQGYWHQPEKTAETFQAYLADTKEGPFLRTGDLGFLKEDGELFVTGRIKDVIIIRGCNHYPQDIEKTVEQSHPALIPHRSAAFSVNIGTEEKLVIVAEVERRYQQKPSQNLEKKDNQIPEKSQFERRKDPIDPGFDIELSEPPIFEQIAGNMQQAVTANHGLQIYQILLLRVGSIPKTSSGKIQHYACRQGFLEDTLNVVYRK